MTSVKPLLIAGLLLLLVAPASAQQDHPPILKSSGEARRSADLGPDTPGKIEFSFNLGEGSAWLLANGEWQVSGMVKHSRLLCATYRLGIRLGRGDPGCLNVVWLTEPAYATERLQCNNAPVEHSGSGSDPAFMSIFDEVTCAQQVVRCSGSC